MNLDDDVVYRCRRLGPLHQPHPGRSRSLVGHHDRFHRIVSSVVFSMPSSQDGVFGPSMTSLPGPPKLAIEARAARP
jgi:hypothetical protein